jgi:hypothetical protein
MWEAPVFFFGGGCQARWVGKGFPTIAAPDIFLMRRNGPQAPGEARGKLFPTIATPGAHPIMLGYSPGIHTGYLPYLEYPVTPSRVLDHRGRKILPPQRLEKPLR